MRLCTDAGPKQVIATNRTFAAHVKCMEFPTILSALDGSRDGNGLVPMALAVSWQIGHPNDANFSWAVRKVSEGCWMNFAGFLR